MAEFVQSNLEEMLPELEQMSRVKLFTSKETRSIGSLSKRLGTMSILKKRKAFEYKLTRKTKQKDDYLQYIQYEMNVLALIRKRRQKTGYHFKIIEIDVAVVSRIHRLFRMACFRFQEDVKLWLSHIEFAKSKGEKTTASKLFTRMLQVHSRKAELWIASAKWEIEANNSMENARSLLQRALRFNPASQRLWVEYFRMELMNVDKLQKRREVLGLAHLDVDDPVVADKIVQAKIAEVAFQQAVAEIPDNIDFVLSFVPVVRLFPFATHVEELIFSHLEEKFGTNEKTWDAKARQVLQRSNLKTGSEANEDAILEIEDKTFSIFDEAVQQLPTERMWTFYLRACLELLNQDAVDSVTLKRISRTDEVFSRAAQKQSLSEEMYGNWMTLLEKTGQTSKVAAVAKEATRRYPTSSSMWLRRLTSEVHAGAATVPATIEAALGAVPEKEGLAVWEFALSYFLLHDMEKAQNLLETAVSQSVEVIALPMKELYLEWAGIIGSIRTVRKVYAKLAASQPLSLEFFGKYIALENAQPEPKMKRIRAAYEDALRTFGSSSPDLWLEYIKTEQRSSKGQPEKAGGLYWRAVKVLDSSLADRFIAQYTLLQSGHLS